MNLTELIKGNYVYFDSYRAGFLHYYIMTAELEKAEPPFNSREVYYKYHFTIPIDDVGNGSLRSPMKAIEVMRWIRKAIDSGELIKTSK